MSRQPGYMPFLAGLAMVGLGLTVRRIAPETLTLPAPATRPRLRDVRRGRDAARVARDGIASVMPANLTASLGRTLIIMGAGVLAIRALDEIVDDDTARY